MPVSGEIIKQKALNLKSAMNIANFNASDGWLQRFKTRFGIRFLKITGEKLSSQPELVDPFKQSLLSSILNTNEPIGIALKKLSLRDVMLNLAAAWQKLDADMISKCWHNLMAEPNANEDDLPLSVLKQRWGNKSHDIVEDTMTLLEAIGPIEISSQEIESWNMDTCNHLQDGDEEDEDSTSDDVEIIGAERSDDISHHEAIQALKTSIEWATQNVNISDILVLKSIQEKAILASVSTKKVQTKISQFFQPL
ncbi:hypothetical protein WA026_022934 [Henosepilachna vigintioctopunctata]|uniref:HTH CENPB-type domain-containing protein n=1 Tax=Henosepilachna vigintioctopunctata TaxID=420089 RepID=A0AAW1TPS4_9CUCU